MQYTDKENRRDIIRRIMRKLEADKKIVVTVQAEKGNRKQFIYKLK
jgi:hypothetical protein